MRNLVHFFVKNPIAGNLLVVLVVLMGYFGYRNMNSTFFPKTPEKKLTIQVNYPGASPEEMEEGIVLKIEESLKGLTGIERVTSVSRENSATIEVEMLTGYDINLVKQDVENAVNQINSFPAGMEVPQIFKQENRNFAFSFALSGPVPLQTLKQHARQVEDQLRATGIMSKIALSGFPNEEIEIAFREEDLRRYQLTFAEATLAVRNANIDLTGGKLKGQQEELLLRARNKGYFAEDLKNIPIKTTDNAGIIYLYQIADIKDQWEDNPKRSFMNGQSSVVITIQNTDDEDLLTIADYMRNYVEEYNKKSSLIQATTIRDGSINLRQRIQILTTNGWQGFLLVLICLGLFLHWRIAFWVASAIPIAFAGMFMLGPTLGITINVISLFGMIIVIGILVDDGIVISENIYTRYEKGEDPETAATEGTIQVTSSIISAIATTIIAFSTFFFVEGRLGEIFSQMALVVVITLFVSLLEGLFVLPGHIAHSTALQEAPGTKNVILRFMDRIMNFLRHRLYEPMLAFSLRGMGWLIPLVLFVGGFMMTIAALMGGKIRTTFFPFIERDDIQVTLNMPAGTREQLTEQWLQHIEKVAWEVNKEISAQRADSLQVIEKIERNILANPYQGSLSISLLDGERRKMGVLDITELIRKKAGPIPGAENLSYGSQSIFGKPVSIAVLSNNLPQLKAAVNALKDSLKTIEDLKDIIDNNQEGLREVNISLNTKGQQLGLNLQEVVAQVRQGFFGSEVQRLQRGRDEVRIWVRYATNDRSSLGQLENMRIRFADGREFPLSEIANFSIERGVVAINHFDGVREVRVEADIANRKSSVTDITARIRNNFIPKLQERFSEVRFTFEGQNKENEKSMVSLQRILPIIFFLMFMAIALTFGSISQAMIVLSLIPFGLIGVGWGHYLLDAQMSFFSILGMVALVGIIVNDSIVFVDAMNERIAQGRPFCEALHEAGISRFRAILLTSLTTILGLGPLILEKSFQAQFLVPMAISVAFGLMVGTFITLILLPVLLLVTNKYKAWVLSLWEGRSISPDEVEPAYPHRHGHFWLWSGSLVLIFIAFQILRMLLAG
jgi:multidrug efflux pump subunit AcrB